MFDKIINELIEKNISISFAESCTGGALASTLTKIPGVSKIFKGSFVTYSIEYKERFLGVQDKTIEKYGVVSYEVAEEMTRCLKKITSADISISVTGNAGPTSGDDTKPLGKVFVGFYIFDKLTVAELDLKGTREEIISSVVNYVFTNISKNL